MSKETLKSNVIEFVEQREDCKICFSECEVSFKRIYECGCKIAICNECLSGCMKSQIESQLQLEELKWICPQINYDRAERRNEADFQSICKERSMDDMLQMIMTTQQRYDQYRIDTSSVQFIIEEVSDTLLKSYMIRQGDVKQCPNQNCSYAGFVIMDQNGVIRCRDKLECMKCGMKWIDPNQERSWFATLTNGSVERIEKFLCDLRKQLIGEPCPKCGVFIQKNGGCKHMVCESCKHEFCWLCL